MHMMRGGAREREREIGLRWCIHQIGAKDLEFLQTSIDVRDSQEIVCHPVSECHLFGVGTVND